MGSRLALEKRWEMLAAGAAAAMAVTEVIVSSGDRASKPDIGYLAEDVLCPSAHWALFLRRTT